MPLLLSGALAQLQLRLAGRRGRSAELRKLLVSTSGHTIWFDTNVQNVQVYTAYKSLFISSFFIMLKSKIRLYILRKNV